MTLLIKTCYRPVSVQFAKLVIATFVSYCIWGNDVFFYLRGYVRDGVIKCWKHTHTHAFAIRKVIVAGKQKIIIVILFALLIPNRACRNKTNLCSRYVLLLHFPHTMLAASDDGYCIGRACDFEFSVEIIRYRTNSMARQVNLQELIMFQFQFKMCDVIV